MSLAKRLNRSLAEVGRLSGKEIAWWLAEDRIAPIDPDLRADFRACMICSTLINLKRRSGAPAVKPIDLMPFLEKSGPAQSTDEMIAVAKSLNRIFKGKITQGKK